jgi:hypothetical protein
MPRSPPPPRTPPRPTGRRHGRAREREDGPVDGKGFADKFAESWSSAASHLPLTAAQTSWTLDAKIPALLVTADGKAAPATRDYPAPIVRRWSTSRRSSEALRRQRQAKIADLEELPAAKFIKAETDGSTRCCAAAGRNHRQAVAPVRSNNGLVVDAS